MADPMAQQPANESSSPQTCFLPDIMVQPPLEELPAANRIPENRVKTFSEAGLSASFFTTAVLQRLVRHPTIAIPPFNSLDLIQGRDTNDNERWTPQQKALYAGLSSDVYEFLRLNVDRRGGYSKWGKRAQSSAQMYAEICAFKNAGIDLERSPADEAFYRSLDAIARPDRYHPNYLQLEGILKKVQYRTDTHRIADWYLDVMGIPRVLGLGCEQFDMWYVEEIVPLDTALALLRKIRARQVLFPEPAEEHGGPIYVRGFYFLAAAFYLAGTTMETVEEKLDALAAKLKEEVDRLKRDVEADATVLRKKANLWKAFDVEVDAVLPMETVPSSSGEAVPSGSEPLPPDRGPPPSWSKIGPSASDARSSKSQSSPF
ncbi:MAG: hypothetical protein LQ342_004576 [Letrouitia transgressa]|nr:MAG: hypothetical protein LQ342_004576 [Letrouitia transgressa]